MSAARRIVCAAALALVSRQAFGDGGAPVASAVGPSGACTLCMQPPEARVGSIEFTLLGALPDGVTLSMQGPDDVSPVVVPWADARRRALRVVTVDLDVAGSWSVAVGLPGEPPTLRASIEVAPPAPSWRARLPWLLAWVPVTLLLAVRHGAVSYTARRARA